MKTGIATRARRGGSMDSVMEAPVSDVVCRVQAEFIEMPGLKLTVPQAQRLWGLDRPTCERVIDKLTATGFLVRTHDDAVMARASELTAAVFHREQRTRT
jgi:Fic family protein